jgi:hypothetical protein
MQQDPISSTPTLIPVKAGAVAGLCVDATLLPLDTVKTRLQSRAGWKASGGLQRLWAGLPAVLLGSAPGSAVFFAAYEGLKASALSDDTRNSPWRVAVCSSVAETVSIAQARAVFISLGCVCCARAL